MDRKSILKEFNSFLNDKEKWQWIQKNQDKNIVIFNYNDDVYGVFEDLDGEERNKYIFDFDYYLGGGDGICILLEAMGIKCEEG